ncbi:MAG: hypothetical protein JW844_04755 [Candidatus Omnitrophica bacterium]|nr:hypothetical protein [Candidatus Omnitrophota bacterium]
MKYEDSLDEGELPGSRECLFMIDIVNHPISTVVDRYKRLGVNPKTGNKWKELWISHGFIIPKRIITKSGWIVLFEITPKGAGILGRSGYHVNTFNESIEHKFWKLKIAEYYEKQGYHVSIEEDNADIAIRKGKNRIAVEIETGNSNHLKNIRRNLYSGFDSVICVPTNGTAQHRISEDLKDNEFGKNVKMILAFKFDVSTKTPKRDDGENGIS